MLMVKKQKTGLPKKLEDLRTRRGLTQVQAAELVGVSPRTWISWENSQRTPGRMARRLLQEAFPSDFPKKK